ncbi:MAG TPA: response regulator transcription factor, partial [Limnochordia bacterium]|nr:response regulator transcription factor [Limnochordia bacterium]
IMIADDHSLYVEGLKNLLQEDFDIVSVVSTGLAAVEEARRSKPDVILMDINMPGLDGIAATRQIMAEQPGIRILMLTSFAETDTLFRAIRAGAVGYLLKNLKDTEIISGLQELQQGRNPFSPGLENKILQEFRLQSVDSPLNPVRFLLNERQIEVLELVAQGLEYAEVGKLLFISERTVKYHVAQIKESLQLSNHAQVVAWAWGHGLGKTVPKCN